MMAIPILVSGVLSSGVADRLVPETPGRESGVDGVFIRIDLTALPDDAANDRLDRGLLYVFEHLDEHVAGALQNAENRWLFLLQGATATRPLQAPPSGAAAFFLTAAG